MTRTSSTRGAAVRWILALALAASAPAVLAADDASPGPLFGAAPDHVIARALIPSDRNAHGELRVARRGAATVVQTVLCSPLLARGLQSIRRKELAAWPDGAEGQADSARFLADLDRAEDAVLAEFTARADGADARRKMLIELIEPDDDARRPSFALYAIDVATDAGQIDVTAARPIAVEPASPGYVARAMRLQAGQALHLDGADLEAVLARH